MFSYPIDSQLSIRRTAINDASALYELVQTNRDMLAKWLPWAKQLNSVADEEQFIKITEANVLAGQELVFTILVNQQVAGLIELHEIDQLNRHAGIGYWLAAEFQHNGIISRALEQLQTIAFKELNLNRLEIIAAVENKASRAVAEWAHFTFEGVLRADLALVDGYHDAAVYSRLATD